MCVSCVKTAEPIEVPFGCGLGWAKRTVYKAGARIPYTGTGTFADLPVVDILHLIR